MRKDDEAHYKAVREGVRDAMLYYLEDHPISMADIIESGIKAAMEEHLTKHQREKL
jgi:hypothetical protein